MPNLTALSKLSSKLKSGGIWTMPDQSLPTYIISGDSIKYLNNQYVLDIGMIPLGGKIKNSIYLTNLSNQSFKIFVESDDLLGCSVRKLSKSPPFIKYNTSFHISIVVDSTKISYTNIHTTLTIKIVQTPIRIAIVIIGQLAYKAFPLGKYSFNNCTYPKKHHFGNFDLYAIEQNPKSYHLRIINNGNQPLQLSIRNCPKWLKIAAKDLTYDKQSSLKNKVLFINVAPDQLKNIEIKPVISHLYIGEHKVRILCETNDFQKKYKSFYLEFFLKIFSAGPYITYKKPVDLLLDKNQNKTVQIVFINWGIESADIQLTYQDTDNKFNIHSCNQHKPARKIMDLNITTKGLSVGVNNVSIIVDIKNGQQQPLYISLKVILKGIMLNPAEFDFGIVDTNQSIFKMIKMENYLDSNKKLEIQADRRMHNNVSFQLKEEYIYARLENIPDSGLRVNSYDGVGLSLIQPDDQVLVSLPVRFKRLTPKACFNSINYDLGQISIGNVYTHSIDIKNEGDGTLTIFLPPVLNIKYLSDEKFDIAPQHSTVLNYEFHSGNNMKSGSFQRMIIIKTNEPEINPVHFIFLNGSIV